MADRADDRSEPELPEAEADGHDPEGQGRRGTRVGSFGCPQGVDRLSVSAGAVESPGC